MKDLWEKLRDPHCSLCSLSQTAKTICLIGKGPVPCDLMIIGEAPGEKEDNVKEPFQGRSGQILIRALRKYDISREDIYLTNAVKCRPPHNDTPGIKMIKACREYLLREIEEVKPKRILAMGTTAVRSVLNKNNSGIVKYRFHVIHLPEFPDIPVYSTYHPAAMLHVPYLGKLFEEDLHFVFTRKKKKHKKKYWLVKSNEEAWRIIKYAATKKEISVDFETTGLNTLYKHFKVLSLSICWREGLSYCIPIEHPESKITEYIQMFKYLFENNKKLIVGGHNIKYEIKCLLAYGVKIMTSIRDTMLEFNILDENYPSKSLYTLKLKYTDDLGLKEERIKPYMADLISLPIRKIASYNCEDTDATFRFMKIFKKELSDNNLDPLNAFQQKAIKMLAEVETTGMSINRRLLEKNMELFAKRKDRIIKSFPGINLNSPKQLGTLLYKKLGLKTINKTASGQGSTSRTDLEILTRTRGGKKHKKLIEEISTYKKLSHFDSHFVTGIYNELQPNDKIYPTYNMARHEGSKGKEVGTVTGRLSASLIHQIPRDTGELNKIFGKETIQIKEMFISSFDNGYITQGDYSQMELRMMGEYSGDKNMLKDFKKGEDIHAVVTYRVMERAPQFYRKYTEFSDKRKATKQINFGIIYLISAWGLAEKLESSVGEAKYIMSEWFKAYPDVKKWLTKMQMRVIRDQYTVSLIGRIRRVPGAEFKSVRGRELIRQGINALMQGLASDINVMLMIELQEEFKKRRMKSRVIGNVHDAVLTDTHPKERKEVKRIYDSIAPKPKLLEELFNVKLTTPLVMDTYQNSTWSKN